MSVRLSRGAPRGMLALCGAVGCGWTRFLADAFDNRHCHEHPGTARVLPDFGDAVAPGCMECGRPLPAFAYSLSNMTAQFYCADCARAGW